MTLKEARAWMLSNPGKKITCQYFHDEWIMFDGSRFVFEDGVEPDSWWWANAYEFKCEWYELKETIQNDTLLNDKKLSKQIFMETKLNTQVNEMNNIQVPSPCDKCPNNKKNNPNASGICSCSLSYFANPIR